MDKSYFDILEQNFRDLLIERCKFCRFDQYLAEHPDFAFPELTPANFDTKNFIIIPGLYGGFAYYLESADAGPVLYAEQSSRMDYSSDDYTYYKVTLDGSEVLESEARTAVQKKFNELVMQEHEQRKRGKVQTDKARGMLVGLAVGDALGANLEFTISHHTEITDDKIALYDGMWPKGAWTDDTSMALCLGQSLLARGGYDSYDVMEKYRQWVEEGYCSYDNKPAGDVGVQTRAAIERFVHEPIIDQYDQRSDRAGNGTLMRLAPVVLATASLPVATTVKLAQISARETHYSWEAEAGTEVFAAILRQALELEDKAKIIHVEKFSTGEIYDDILSRAINGSEKNCQTALEDTGGYVVDALAIALWGFRNFDTFESGLRAVIKLGGDTDTNGAIYGQLAGAYYGYGAIPALWREELLREGEIRELADQLLAMPACPILRTRFEEDT